MQIARWLHLTGIVVWVGGMFFAHFALRPAAAELAPPVRLPLLLRTLSGFDAYSAVLSRSGRWVLVAGRTAVRILLTTQHPMFIFWGGEHICLYNDAYSGSLGPEKHPAILGARGREAWDEIWPSIGPQIDHVLSGKGATWHKDQLLPILRHGRLGIFQILFEWVRKSRPVYLLGSGHNRYQFVHADDLAAACLLADGRKENDVLLCGTDRFGTMRELLEGLVAHAGSHSSVRSLPFKPTVVAMKVTSKLGVSPLGDYHSLMYGREMFFDITSTSEAIGWKPQYSNAEMIADSYDWYVAHREEVLRRHGASHHRSPVKLGVLKLLERLP